MNLPAKSTVPINPRTWLNETLTRLANGHPANCIGDLISWTTAG